MLWCVCELSPKTLAFAFALCLPCKSQRSKTHVLRRRVPNGKPQKRLRFRAMCGKMLGFKKRIAIISYDLEAPLGAFRSFATLFFLFVVEPTKFVSYSVA